MSPKFRGGSDDWLDEERSSGRHSTNKKKTSKDKVTITAGEANATVAEVYPKQCRVHLDEAVTPASKGPLCTYRRASVCGVGGELRERSPVAVGDRVKVLILSPDAGVVEGICDRATQLLRPTPDREERSIHVIAANVELMVVVASPVEPEFTPGLVDRFLIAAQRGGITPILCLNKIDLAGASSDAPWAAYRGLGIDVFEVSAKRAVGIDPLKAALVGKSVVFCGHSGVGKTSLLRTLTGREIGKIGEVSSVTGKGRHTTTVSTLLRGPEGARWVDTPGVKEFGLAALSPKALASCFPEFAALACAGSGCLHLDEPDCRARELWRYPSYRRILESLIEGNY